MERIRRGLRRMRVGMAANKPASLMLVVAIVATGIFLGVRIVRAATAPAAVVFDVCEDSDVSGDAFIGHDHTHTSCGHYVSFGFEPITNVTTSLTAAATGVTAPVDIANTGVAGDTRLFIVGQQGKIYVSPNNGSNVSGSVFLDLTSKVKSGGEQGLLGLAFDPNYSQNGYFYVYYTTNIANLGTFNGQTITTNDIVVERYTRSTTDTNKADPNSGLIILGIDDPESNHNGGGLHFYTDGYLYISVGDGGSGGDPHTQNCAYGNGQCLSTYLGKILRIDVRNSSASQRYVVPGNNPFVSTSGAKPEIWLYGLRNPWRYSFDDKTGDMFIGDVGQSNWEEIDILPAGAKGKNFGWRCLEGTHTYDNSANAACATLSSAANYVAPVYEYDHGQGCSITGGYIYRGSAHPEFDGTYVFSDYCTSKIWYLNKQVNGTWALTNTVDAGLPANSVSSFGEDINGELYIATLNGTVFRINISH